MKKKHFLTCFLLLLAMVGNVHFLRSQVHPNLVLCHRNDATNGFTDGSSFGNNGTNVGAPGVTFANDRNNTANSAGAYDENNYISVNDHNSLDLSSCYTIMAWIRPNTGYGTDYNNHIDIVSKWGIPGSGNAAYLMGLSTSGNVLGWTHDGTNNGLSQSASTVPVNQWTHVAITYDGSNMRFYINGTLNATVANTIVPQNSGFPVRIGHEGENTAGNSNTGFDGLIDEVKVFNTMLNASAISALANINVNSCPTTGELSAFQPGFVNLPANICEAASLTVTLNNTNYLGNGTFNWGDGTSSSSNVKTYNTAGTYTIIFTTTGACPQSCTASIVVEDCHPCDINNTKTEFTQSYTGPNGETLYESWISNTYQHREVNFSHVKKLANGEIVMAGSMIKDNLDNISISNRELEPAFLFQRVPIIQKLDDKGVVLISKRLDQLTAAGSNISLVKNAELKRIAGMVTDASNNIYLLITESRKDYLDTPPPNYFEIMKLTSALVPAPIVSGQNNYIRISYSGFDHIFPSDMIMAGNVLRVLAAATDQSNMGHVMIASVPTTLGNAGTARSATANVWGNQITTSKMAVIGTNIFFLYNHDFNAPNFVNTEIYVGRFNYATPGFNLTRSFGSLNGSLYPEGIKTDPNTPNRLLVYGSIFINNKHYPSLHVLDNNLTLWSVNYYEYQATTNANPADDVRLGTYGENAYADDVFFHNNSYILHTTLRGEMDPFSPYSQVPNLYNMVPGYFSVSKSQPSTLVVDATFPSVFDPNIFKINDRQKYFVPPGTGVLGEQLLGKFEEHFFRFEKQGGILNCSDFASSKIYNMDGQRTLSVFANTYASAEPLTCFQEIDVARVNLSSPTWTNWQWTNFDPARSYTNPILRATKLNISSSCCIPEYHRPCGDIGDIQVSFETDCANNKVKIKFTGANVSDIEMMQIYQVTPYDPTYNLGYFSDVLYNETGLTEVNATPNGGILKDGDEYCIIIYAKNGCMKQFCTTVDLPEPAISSEEHTLCGENATYPYTPNCANSTTYTLQSNGGTVQNFTYPASTHNLGAGTHVFKSYNANGCLECIHTVTITTIPKNEVVNQHPIDVFCGAGINLTAYETCPIGNALAVGPWTDVATGTTYSSSMYFFATQPITLRRVVNYGNCSTCVDEIIITIIQRPPVVVEICLEENDCEYWDVHNFSCGAIMPGEFYYHTWPNGQVWWNLGGLFEFCNPDDIGFHIITYVNEYGCTCTFHVNVIPGPCPEPAQLEDNKIRDRENQNNVTRNLNAMGTQTASNIKVFPNPSTGIYNLIYTSSETSQIAFSTEVYDISGKLVHAQSGFKSNQQGQLNLSELSQGIYTLKVIFNNKTETVKLIKN